MRRYTFTVQLLLEYATCHIITHAFIILARFQRWSGVGRGVSPKGVEKGT
jgi:hypothetical protein